MFSLLRLRTPLIRYAFTNGDILKNYYSKKISAREKDALFKTMCLIDQNPECYGIAFFKDLFKKYPEYSKFFTKYGDCPEEILKNPQFAKNHAKKLLMKTLSQFVRKIDDACDAESMMKDIGKKHIKLCVKKEHFKNSKKILLKSIEYNLGDKWNAEVEQGWKKAMKILFRGLINGLKKKKCD